VRLFFKSWTFRVLIAIATALLCVMILSPANAAFTGAAMAPVQSFAAKISRGVSGWFAGDAEKQNAALQSQIDALRQGQLELDELRRENAQYQAFLGIKQSHPDYHFVNGFAVAADPSNIYHNFAVGVGKNDGIAAGDPVLTPEGLVGVVAEAGPNYANVRTLLDPAAQLGAYVSRTGDSGMLAASDGEISLTRLDKSCGVKAGDLIATYGSGQYPRGLPVGEVTTVNADRSGVSLTAAVSLFADTGHVTEVMILIDFNGKTKN